MKAFKFYFAVFVVLFLSSCSQKVANIKELYNSGEAFEIEFASWESFDQSVLKDADMQTPEVDFFYSKKTNRVVVTFEDGRIGKYDVVKYNKIHSDDVQVCLQNDYVRFVIMNNGKRYSLKMLGWNLWDWHDLAYFEDGKGEPINSIVSVGSGNTYLMPIFLIILIGLLIWGIVKKKKWAIIVPSILLAAIIIINVVFYFDWKKPSSAKPKSKLETKVMGDSLCSATKNEHTDVFEKLDTNSVKVEVPKKVAIDSLWSATGEGYAVVYEHPDGSSAEIGKIYNEDKCIYPVYAIKDHWYEIGFSRGIGYVYDGDCILQSEDNDI